MARRFPAVPALFRNSFRRARRPRYAPPFRNHLFVIAKRPAAPRYWQNIASLLRALPSPDITDAKAIPDATERWRRRILVLQAKAIPFRFFERNRPALYVPPVAAKAALHEIAAFEAERPAPPLPTPPERRGTYWYMALVALLVPWHRMRWDALLPLPFLPATAREWLTQGGLDAYRVAVSHEWWRSVTALTLHADGAHLVSNVLMGCVFGIPLCRHTGVGFGFLLTILAGALGNIATAFLRPASAMSQGFSTALFASVGLLAAFSAAFAVRHSLAAVGGQHNSRAPLVRGLKKGLLPVGAGLGFLAMLGGADAPNVDYLAHVMGLFAGLLTGAAASFALPQPPLPGTAKDRLLQVGSLVAAAALICASWAAALAV